MGTAGLGGVCWSHLDRGPSVPAGVQRALPKGDCRIRRGCHPLAGLVRTAFPLLAGVLLNSVGAYSRTPNQLRLYYFALCMCSAAAQALALARQIGCAAGGSVDAECLRAANSTAILAAMGPEYQGLVTAPLWCPVIDGRVLPRDPLAAFADGGWCRHRVASGTQTHVV